MKVKLLSNPHNEQGLSVVFPYNPADVDVIRSCLGFTWDKTLKAWTSEGPEVLLDMQRFGVEVEWVSKEARQISENFRQQLWDTIDCRVLDIDADTYGFQQQGTEFLSIMPHAILGDDMGTGKSKQSLDAAAKVGAKHILVLCPKTLAYNWKNEVALWQPQWTTGVVPDLQKSKQKHKAGDIGRDEFWRDRPNITIANYEKLSLIDWPFPLDWDVVILDEATKFKNSNTQVYKNVKRVVRRSQRAWALTGTPLEIKLQELYNIMGLLRPAVVGGFHRFKDQHIATDWAGNITGAKNLQLLRERIGPFILRRTKGEVLKQLPPKVYQNIFAKLTTPEEKAYQSMTASFNNWLTEHGVSGAGDGMTEILRMRQFCCSPDLFTSELGKGAKFQALQELLSEWPGRVVIFCFFTEVTRRLAEWLKINPRAYIDGSVKQEERFLRATDFSNGKLGQVFVSSEAGDKGLNIPGANMVVHYDQLWNPQLMHQREDRLHRIGQTDNVTVVNLMCLDTIDYGMYQLNREREHLFEEVVDGAEEAMLKKLNAPRLRQLVEGRLNEP